MQYKKYATVKKPILAVCRVAKANADFDLSEIFTMEEEVVKNRE